MKKRRRISKRKKKVIRRRLLILLFAAVVAILVFFVYRMISTYEQSVLEEESQLGSAGEELAENPYEYSGMSFDGEYAAYRDDNYTSRQGIDVSSHNGDIDWSAVHNANINFAMIRCGYRGYDEGAIKEDSSFETNYEGAVENGIETGVYFFSQATTVDEAAEEADFVIDHIKNKQIDLPVVFDMEIPDTSARVASLSREEKTRIAVTFMNRIEDAGYQAMIYGSSQQMNTVFDLRYLQDFSFWIAEYESPWPDYAYMYTMWQYSSTGQIDGIDSNVDMDILFVRRG